MSETRSDDLVVDFDGAVSADAGRRAAEVFAEQGCFVARGLFRNADLEPIRAAFRRIIGLHRQAMGLPPRPDDSSAPFDDGFLELIELDPDGRRLIQMTSMFALPLVQFGADERLARLSRRLMNTDAVIASDLQSIHISLPREEAHLLPWHQDYPWVQDSEDALIYWMPIRDLPDGNAALRVALGSHRLGVLRLLERDGRLMGLADPEVADRFPQRVVSLRAGEALVLSTLLLHRSVRNNGDTTRWTSQVRHGNFANPKAVRRRWPGPRPDRTPFSETHPEYYSDDPPAAMAPTGSPAATP
jgi:Phytanoyl-CoA dioxygenase (PhyH)